MASDAEPRGRSLLTVVVIGVALLLPCFWQSKLVAGDLQSHSYNAWLAREIERGRVQGVELASPKTNVLFDHLLSGLSSVVGHVWAEKLAAATVLLIFCLGWIALLKRTAGRAPWPILLLVVMFSHGFVFRLGLHNFLLSLGLVLGAMALSLGDRRRSWLLALGLALLAATAHPVPLAWGIGAVAYWRIAIRGGMVFHHKLLGAGVLVVVGVTGGLHALFPSFWSAAQLGMVTGADQLYVYGREYVVPVSLVLLACGVLALSRRDRTRGSAAFLDVPLQLFLLAALLVALLPRGVLLPGYRHGLVFLPDRMSLVCLVLLSLSLARERVRLVPAASIVVAFVSFFAFVYADTHHASAIEEEMAAAVRTLPGRPRVVSSVRDQGSRIDRYAHLIDRVCIDRCYSYANYEPSTGQFRTRATRQNPYVLWEYRDVRELRDGLFRVRREDLPLYLISTCVDGARLCARALELGEQAGQSRAPRRPSPG